MNSILSFGSSITSFAFLILVCMALLKKASTQDREQTYPEEIHKLVVQRLGSKSRGGDYGSWGSWSAWSTCSKSCGTGVSTQMRECLNTYGPYGHMRRRLTKLTKSSENRCIGRYKRFQLCNTQSCGAGATDFRKEQCATFNGTPFNQRVYTWEPYYDTPESCTLNCRPVGHSFYATLNQTVLDGTACGLPGSHKICVAGRCMEIGCDGVLGSGQKIDGCGVCGGHNTTCRMVSGVYSRPTLSYGYSIIATLPIGASNISIQQIKPSSNFLAMKEQNGDFFLNGNWAINSSGIYRGAGATFNYAQPKRYYGDSITSSGPLHIPVDVMLFYQGTNPGIKYDYRLAVSEDNNLGGLPNSQDSRSVKSHPPPSGTWPSLPSHPYFLNKHNGFSLRTNSDASLQNLPNGFGQNHYSSLKYPNHLYYRQYNPSSLYPSTFNSFEHPAQLNVQPFMHGHKYYSYSLENPSTIEASTQSPMIVSVHNHLQKSRLLHPHNTSNTASDSAKSQAIFSYKGPINDAWIENEIDPNKKEIKKYYKKHKKSWKKYSHKKKKRYEWKVIGFSSCSQSCGSGTQTTRIVCAKRKNGNEVPSKFCIDFPKPEEEVVRCNLKPCPPEWMPNSWGPCSVTCGIGIQRRNFTCKQRISPEVINAAENTCPESNTLPGVQICESMPCNASPKWEASEWHRCSADCGTGTRTRTIRCTNLSEPVADDLCDLKERPGDHEMCDMGSCATDTWFFSKWDTICTEQCGKGLQRRRVHCLGDTVNGNSNSSPCELSAKPPSVRSCTDEEGCGGVWFTGPWEECNALCGKGKQTRMVICIIWSRGQYRVSTDHSECKQSKPPSDKECIKTCRPDWFTSEWSKCSAECAGGVQRREVKCLDENSNASVECPAATKPDTRQICNTQSCKEGIEIKEKSDISLSRDEPQETDDKFSIDQGKDNETAGVDSRYLYAQGRGVQVIGGNGDKHETGRRVAMLSGAPLDSCIDRMKNCQLVYKARLCRLKYYNKLCCETCSKTKKQSNP